MALCSFRRWCCFASVLAMGCMPARAAEELLLQLDGLALPIDLVALESWTRQPEQASSELTAWLNLLEPQSRRDLIRLLQAPLVRDRSFGLQLLNSWTGEQMLKQAGSLLTTGADNRSTKPLLLSSLRRLLEMQSSVSTLELLRALPVVSVTLSLDESLQLASQWRSQLQWQNTALERLRQLPLPGRSSRPLGFTSAVPRHPQRLQLQVPHRVTTLQLELWPTQQARRGPWLLLMPGLGGSSDQLSWLAAALADRGWPVLVVADPGSDELAIQASLLGDAPPPGAETLPKRLADLHAVLEAQREGQLPAFGPAPAGEQGVVLGGHSLGGLAALMGAGLVPERGLGRRCELALASLPLTNLSRLLQCQLPGITGDGQASAGILQPQATPLLGVVAFNGFGSLLWPHHGLQDLNVPVLLVGGSLDLVTPPVQEQLAVFAGSTHPNSRLVLVEGASHFSPVRIENQGEALFRLGEQLIGIEPLKVQALLLNLTSEFLQGFEQPLSLSPQRREQNGVWAYVLDRNQARRWQKLVAGY
ncbi:MAG: alpha/beta hydrolase [Cyanobacteria bacterium]|nr:alpha/beta hydrolase [Cyanobacteriota bacterium]